MAGSLDFNFNPGPLETQSASLQILDFTSNGELAGDCPCGTGDVSGQLPATLTFDNLAGFNDYFDHFTFGMTISFGLSLYGPALSAPDGLSSSGSRLAFSVFSDAAGTLPALTTDTTDGFAFTVDVNLDGTTTVTNSSAQTTIAPFGSPTPEPASWTEMALAIGVWLMFRFRRRCYLLESYGSRGTRADQGVRPTGGVCFRLLACRARLTACRSAARRRGQAKAYPTKPCGV